MMRYDIHPEIVLRVPRFPVTHASLPTNELLQNPVFREALYLASDSMTEELSRNGFQFSDCSEKMKHSLMKYQKRMSYRPTPFGGFAGVGLLSWKDSNEGVIVIDGKSFQTSVIEKQAGMPGIDSSGEAGYRINPLIYPYGTDYRIIAKQEKGVYCISEIFASDAVKAVLSHRRRISHEALLIVLEKAGISADEFENYLSEMLDLQLLLHIQLQSHSFPIPLSAEHRNHPGTAYDSYCNFSASGSLHCDFSRQLRDGIYCLEKLSSVYDTATSELSTFNPIAIGSPLSTFKDRFAKLFDRREVALLQALDPELGIDYDGLSEKTNSLPGVYPPGTPFWSPVHELILSKWTSNRGDGIPEINLLNEGMAGLNTPLKNYPPGMSVLFSTLGDRLHIKGAGGAGSLNMIGRFTVLDPKILKLAQDLASMEMARNPEVVFAEISHIDSDQAASVKQRAMVYEYEIPFFESPSLPDERVITPSDLYISLVHNRLVLRSAKLNKQVIPRFSCAYNYHNSTSPIFRFLCDLQHEGISGNLNFSLAKLFPGLPAYPRLVYKDVILEAASWHPDAKQLTRFKKLDPNSQFAEFRAFAKATGLPDEFCYEVHDHLLHINRNVSQDVCLLLKSLPSSGRIVLREYLAGQESLVTNSNGHSYTHEGVAFLTNKTASYSAAAIRSLGGKRSPICKEKLFPFDDWLYLKIYLHPAGYSDLLLQHLQPFIFTNKAKGSISSWFFVSYFDDDDHLRIRLRQVPGRETYLLKSYRKLEQALRQLPNVRKVELSTYFRETKRYSGIGMECAEELFHLSSEMVLAELRNPLADDPAKARLFSAIRFLLSGCKVLNKTYPEMENFGTSVTEGLNKTQRLEWDAEFRAVRLGLKHFLDTYREEFLPETDYLERLGEALATLSPHARLQALTDLNHMHLNRLFLHDQPLNEKKAYYFMAKMVRSMYAAGVRGIQQEIASL